MDFDEFQVRSRETDFIPEAVTGISKLLYSVLGAGAQLGDISGLVKKKMRDGDDYAALKPEIAERMGYLMWYISTAATELNLTLSDVAKQNVAFNRRRWNQAIESDGDEPSLFVSDFDDGFPVEQQLPRSLWAHFIETSTEDSLAKIKVEVTLDDDPSVRDFGDTIDDNANAPDGYRYHDVFHFGYFAFLDWSPVIRGLLKRKRKLKPEVDRVEDGARARDREEAVTVFIYNYVSRHRFFETATNLDTDLLVQVRRVVSDLEVKSRQEREWERAVIAAAHAQRDLMANKGGWIRACRRTRSLYFSKSGPGSSGSK